MSYKGLKGGHRLAGFILFHNKGLAPGKALKILGEQRDNIPPMIYNHRKDINIVMRDL